MKNNNLTQYSIAELIKQKKTFTGILVGFAIIMLSASAILLFLILKHKNLALVATIPCLFVTLLPVAIRLNQINTEIKSRK